MATISVVRPDVTAASLRAWREARHLYQAQLAEMLGVDQPTISRWETGHGDIPPYFGLVLNELARQIDPQLESQA
jgi:transcriptional regulator with XRE-family HTH domain